MAFTNCCWLTKLLFLLLLMSRAPHAVNTRPARGSPTSELIAGKEFLKLFMGRDELQRDLYSDDYEGHADSSITTRSSNFPESDSTDVNYNDTPIIKTRNNARSLDYKAAHNSGNSNKNNGDDDDNNDDASKQVVKLVTSGSKIVFLEEYEDVDDAVVDAVARDIDLKREKVKKVNHHKVNNENRNYQESKTALNDEFKVVAVSVSSSSKRSSPVNRQTNEPASKPVSKFSIKTSYPAEQHESRYLHNSGAKRLITTEKTTTTRKPDFNVTTTTSRPATTKTTLTTTTTKTNSPIPATNDIDEFINRSHKSEFSIEEAEPLTMPQKQNKMRRAHAAIPDSDNDSENSASSNIQNILIPSASMRSSSIAMPLIGNRNSTQPSRNATQTRQARINQKNAATYDMGVADVVDNSDTATAADLVEDKLLPFQTVIYHDHGQEGRGPQSRSISYSSISQNVDDLQKWQQAGILAEAQRNVSESLKPLAKEQTNMPVEIQHEQHESEPAKFYSVPSKMYSIPSKIYSEPAKVYSQPAKVYGQPEKFYSEPAKVYGEPSKFYSEPAKVYSQPAKVYGEPAKTYWPQTVAITTTTTSTSSTTTTMTPASQTLITTFAPFAAAFNLTSRRQPAIVSRIAFGETVSSTASPLPADVGVLAKNSAANIFQQHIYNQQHTHQSQNQYQQSQQQNNRLKHQNTQSRRVLFNLDKLPYDLLNSPEQHLLEPDLLKTQLYPCATSNAAQQHLRQHSSFSDQHSNQNAKGLPNRDLVKCVSKFSVAHQQTASATRRPPSASSENQQQQQHHPHQKHYFTTERSNIDELYQPTPEQNYEIEESVSVMTNGRAHDVQGNPALVSMTTTSTTSKPLKAQPTRNRFRPTGGTNLHTFGHAKSKDNDADNDEKKVEHSTALVHHNKNKSNNNSNNKSNNKNRYHNNNNDYYDDDGVESEDHVNDNSDCTDGAADNDDSKVAYVVEGRNYRKYRVEEKTDDGFIVGEFGVVDHNDGNLRGVRYTADSTINPSLIQKALVAFLKLK